MALVLIGTTALASTTIAPTITILEGQTKQEKPVPTTSPQKSYTREELIKALADKVQTYGGNYAELYNTIQCESGFIWNAKGDGGLAFGPAQFHKTTFDYFATLRGEKMNYYNAIDQLDMMVWAFNHDLKYHWTCWKNLR